MEMYFFHFYFLNKDISVTNQDKLLKFSGILLEVPLEGSVSQILYLGSSCNSMLCRKKDSKNIPKVPALMG